MIFRVLLITATAGLLSVPQPGVAQTTSGDVTFEWPLNLTEMSPDITKIQVFCIITSDAIPEDRPRAKGATRTLKAEVELAVAAGQLVTTSRVVIPTGNLDNPIGKTASYECSISGFSKLLQRWSFFSEGDPTPAFRLTPTPQRASGSFVW